MLAFTWLCTSSRQACQALLGNASPSVRNQGLTSSFPLVPEQPTDLASQRSLHNAPIFRLLLKVAVNGTHQCDSIEFLRDRKIPTNTKVYVYDKTAA